jgi:hypothetical protein
MHRHYKDCSRSKTLASADKPVNANQHNAALRSPLLDTCYLARAISSSGQHYAAFGAAVSTAPCPRGACMPLAPESQSQKQGAQASNNRPAVRM